MVIRIASANEAISGFCYNAKAPSTLLNGALGMNPVALGD
jgi:hypothetical protein